MIPTAEPFVASAGAAQGAGAADVSTRVAANVGYFEPVVSVVPFGV